MKVTLSQLKQIIKEEVEASANLTPEQAAGWTKAMKSVRKELQRRQSVLKNTHPHNNDYVELARAGKLSEVESLLVWIDALIKLKR